MLKLLEVRAATFTNFSNSLHADSGREMTDDEIKAAWSNRLQAMFRDEMDDHEADDAHLSGRKKRQRFHNRFSAWRWQRFGPHEQIRNVLRHGCPRSVIERLLELNEST